MFCHLRRREGVSESRMDYTSCEDFDQLDSLAGQGEERRSARLGRSPRAMTT